MPDGVASFLGGSDAAMLFRPRLGWKEPETPGGLPFFKIYIYICVCIPLDIRGRRSRRKMTKWVNAST